MNLMSVDMGIDMGTSRTRVYLRGSGIVLDEPSYIAVSYREGNVVSVGKEAYKIFGRCPPHVEVHRPLHKGVIEDFELAEAMLREFLDRLFKRKALLGARVVMVVPSGATDVEKKAFEDIAMQVGGREVMLIEAPVAAAIGSGLPINNARGLVSLYLGGGTTQSAVFTGGELLFTHYQTVGGEDLTDSIINGLRKKKDEVDNREESGMGDHQVLIGNHTAEQLKVSMGSAFPTEKDETREIYGKSVGDGLPKAVFVANWELMMMMKEPLNRIANVIKEVLEKIPPELAEDVKKTGLYLSGGNSRMRGMATLIHQISGVNCITSKKGQHSCVLGTEKIITEIKEYRRFTTSSHSRNFTG